MILRFNKPLLLQFEKNELLKRSNMSSKIDIRGRETGQVAMTKEVQVSVKERRRESKNQRWQSQCKIF